MAKDREIDIYYIETRKHVIVSRLRKLASFLLTLPTGKFHYGEWAKAKDDNKLFCDLNQCGTVACALGWATAIPAFRRKGLRLNWLYGPYGYVVIKGKFTYGEPLFGYDARNIFMSGQPTKHNGLRSPKSNCTAAQMADFLFQYAAKEEACA